MEEKWVDFLTSYCDCELEEILRSSQNILGSSQQTLLIDGSLLLDYDLQLCSALLSEPRTHLAALNRAAVEAQRKLLANHQSSVPEQEPSPHVNTSRDTDHVGDPSHVQRALTVKESVHVRLHNLPNIPELVRNRVPSSVDKDKYLIVNGTVIRTGNTKVLERVQIWRCNSCQGVTETEGLLELRYKLTSPKKCRVHSCRGHKFTHLQTENMRCSDYQEIRIQEKVERLDMGTIPRSMTVVLEYDLVDNCKAGDDVTIHGVVTQIWDTTVIDARCTVETVLHANYIQIHNEQRCSLDVTDNAISRHYAHWRRYRDTPISGRNLILASFCPEVYQLYIVKLAALLVMLGGVTHTDGRGSKVRGECHLLMVGDPGTGKSQILKYASKLSPRSVITTGIGCTKAGLTVAAVKEGGEWALEAGAMVLADGGVCCVDELSSIRESDRVAIHEAMEQQTISVAKAGLVCKLNTRTTVLAATNPRGSYDITQPISANVPIGTPLLSRFDLILVLFDDHTARWDSLVAGYLLKEQHVLQETDILKNYPADTLWSFKELQEYVSHVKSLKPKLTKQAKEVLGRYYRRQREQISRNVSRTTIRMLESLVRLSQAHAKLMMHERVELMDAIVTISLVECTMLNSSLLGSVSVLHSVFPAKPELEFQKQKTMILEVLGIPPDFGEKTENTINLPPLMRTETVNLDPCDAMEVPSFQVDTQELRNEHEKNAPLSELPVSSLEKNAPVHPESSKQNEAASRKLTRRCPDHSILTPTVSSASSNPAKKSFAELVRNFKQTKRARMRAPVVDNTDPEVVLDDLLNQDLSDILCPPRSLPPSTSTETSNQTPPNLSVPESEAEISTDLNPMSGRNNTPVTKMYEMFNASQVDKNSTQSSASHFSPIINTQSVGLTSSVKENQAPPPHFSLSPVPIVTDTRVSDVTNTCDDVTPHELAAKTARPQERSLFHTKSAEKLKRFSFQPRKRN